MAWSCLTVLSVLGSSHGIVELPLTSANTGVGRPAAVGVFLGKEGLAGVDLAVPGFLSSSIVNLVYS